MFRRRRSLSSRWPRVLEVGAGDRQGGQHLQTLIAHGLAQRDSGGPAAGELHRPAEAGDLFRASHSFTTSKWPKPQPKSWPSICRHSLHGLVMAGRSGQSSPPSCGSGTVGGRCSGVSQSSRFVLAAGADVESRPAPAARARTSVQRSAGPWRRLSQFTSFGDGRQLSCLAASASTEAWSTIDSYGASQRHPQGGLRRLAPWTLTSRLPLSDAVISDVATMTKQLLGEGQDPVESETRAMETFETLSP